MSADLSRRGFLKGLLTAAVAGPVIYSFPKLLTPLNVAEPTIVVGTAVHQGTYPASAFKRALEYEMERLKEAFITQLNYDGPVWFVEQDGCKWRREDDGQSSAILTGGLIQRGSKAGEIPWGRIVVPSLCVPDPSA